MPGSTSTSGIGKFSASTTTASKVGRVELAARVRTQRAVGDLGQRAVRQPRRARARPLARSSRARRARRPARAPRAAPSRSETAAAAAARRYEAHVERTRAPLPERSARRRSAARRQSGVRTAAVIAAATRGGDVGAGAQREERRPGSRQTAAERAGVDGRALDDGQTRHERRPARLGDRVFERAADEREVAAVQPVDERAQVGPLPHGIGERHRRAEQRARLRRFDLEIGMHDDGRQARRHRQPQDVGRVRAADEHEPAADARRDVVGVRRSGAEPLAFERAGDQRLGATTGADQRVDRDDRGGGAGRAAAEAARQRQPLADASARRRAVRRACVSSASAATPAVFCAASRGRRPPSPSMLSIRTPGVSPGRNRAVTSSPGSSSAKPRTSKPHATFDTVAGAKAVTEVMVRSGC